MKKQILELRSQGKSYNEIARLTGASKGTISYHCGIGQREKSNQRNYTNRDKKIKNVKIEYGGKCSCCSYKRCFNALQFHHIDPQKKLFEIGHAIRKVGMGKLKAELEKCILVCSNCHAEIHAGIRKVDRSRVERE